MLWLSIGLINKLGKCYDWLYILLMYLAQVIIVSKWWMVKLWLLLFVSLIDLKQAKIDCLCVCQRTVTSYDCLHVSVIGEICYTFCTLNTFFCINWTLTTCNMSLWEDTCRGLHLFDYSHIVGDWEQEWYIIPSDVTLYFLHSCVYTQWFFLAQFAVLLLLFVFVLRWLLLKYCWDSWHCRSKPPGLSYIHSSYVTSVA